MPFDTPPMRCAPSYSALAPDTCFVAPAPETGKKKPVPLLVYLHALYKPDADGEEVARQERIAQHAVAHGVAVLALRGKMGLCDTRGDHVDWICWPSNEKVAFHAQEIVDGWKAPLAAARAHTGLGPTYVLGFSNGAYFAALLAVRALFPADAFVVAQGGAVEPVHALGRKPRLLLLTTDGQAPTVQAEMDRFASALASDGWSFVEEERPGGHELSDSDIDAALDFLLSSTSKATHG